MIPCLFYQRRFPTAFSASSTTTGYEANNTRSSSIAAAWISQNLAANPDFVQWDLGNSYSVAGIFAQHVAMRQPSLLADGAATPTTSRATYNASNEPGAAFAATKASPAKGCMDRHGIARLRGVNYNANMLPIAYTARYVRVSNNNNDNDLSGLNYGLGAYRSRPDLAGVTAEVGALYVFDSFRPLVSTVRNGARVTYNLGREVRETPAGRLYASRRSPPYCEVELDFTVRRSPTSEYRTLTGLSEGDDDIEVVARLASAEVCWLDLGIADKPWLSWPVRLVDADFDRRVRVAGGSQDQITLKFREVV